MIARVEWKASPSGLITGYGSVFHVIDAYGDRVMPGAFAASLQASQSKGRWPAMLWQHDYTRPIGAWDAMQEDATGLHVRGRLALDSADGRDAYALLTSGALDGLSIGFRTVQARQAVGPDGTSIRELLAVELHEVSPVVFPANDAARVIAVKQATPSSPEDEARLALEMRAFSAQLRAGAADARIAHDLRDAAASLRRV